MSFLNRNIDRDDVRRYLLGSLPERRREQLERRFLTDSFFNEEVLATEDDLVDDYLAEKLNEQERRQFESLFLITKERQRKVRFARAFRRYLISLQVAESQQPSRSIGRGLFSTRSAPVVAGFFRRNPVLAMSLTIIVCLGMFGLSWVFYKRQTQSVVQGQVIAITLLPGSSRSEGGVIQRLERPAVNSLVQVELQLGTSEYRTYQVELLSDNQPVATFKSLLAEPKNDHFVLRFVTESRLLPRGDYRVKLSGISDSGQVEFKDEYRFRVLP
jgi:hypothetical protein